MAYRYYNHHLSNGWRTSWDDWSSRLWIKIESLPSTASLSSPGSLSPFKELLGLIFVNVVSGSEAVGERTVWHPLSKQKNCEVVCAAPLYKESTGFGISLPPSLPLCPFYHRKHSCSCRQGKARSDRPQEVSASVPFFRPGGYSPGTT